MLSVLIFFLILSVLVIGHELGHYIAARLTGVKAEEFGFGFPPRLGGLVRSGGHWKYVTSRDRQNYKHTVWSLNWLPLGGFVRLKGEETGAQGEADAFQSKPPQHRFFILASGVLMNWLIAVAIFTGGLAIGVPTQIGDLPPSAIVRERSVRISQVMPQSGAALGGLQNGDKLLAINGQIIADGDVAQSSLRRLSDLGYPIALQVERAGQSIQLSVTPRFLAALNRPAVGIAMVDVGTVRFPWYRALPEGVRWSYTYSKLILNSFRELIKNAIQRKPVQAELSGPIGIAVMTGKIAREGIWPLFQFAALLSLNLAILNALPIPALDGGRLFFVLMEALRRQKINQRWEIALHRFGFMALLALIAIVTLKDLHQYGNTILQGIKTMIGV